MILFKFHHGGSFCKDPVGNLMYKNGMLEEWPECDEDVLDVFSFRNFSKSLGYAEVANVLWLVPNEPLATGLKELNTDADLIQMVDASKLNAGVMHIYYEHPITQPEVLSYAENEAEADADTIANLWKSGSSDKKIKGDKSFKITDVNLKNMVEGKRMEALRKRKEAIERKKVEAESKKKAEAEAENEKKKKLETEKKKTDLEKKKKLETEKKKADLDKKNAEIEKKKAEIQKKKVEAENLKRKLEEEKKKAEIQKKKKKAEIEEKKKKAEIEKKTDAVKAKKNVEPEGVTSKADAVKAKNVEAEGVTSKPDTLAKNKGKKVMVSSDDDNVDTENTSDDSDDEEFFLNEDELIVESDDYDYHCDQVEDCLGHRQNYETNRGEDIGEDSWMSEVLKTPENSDDDADSKEVHPKFNENSVFGSVSIDIAKLLLN